MQRKNKNVTRNATGITEEMNEGEREHLVMISMKTERTTKMFTHVQVTAPLIRQQDRRSKAAEEGTSTTRSDAKKTRCTDVTD